MAPHDIYVTHIVHHPACSCPPDTPITRHYIDILVHRRTFGVSEWPSVNNYYHSRKSWDHGYIICQDLACLDLRSLDPVITGEMPPNTTVSMLHW